MQERRCPTAPVRQGRETRPGHQFINQPTYRGLRTDTHTYAVAESGRWCLYDNVADPFQMKNLVRDPAHQAMMTGFDQADRGMVDLGW